MAYHSTKNTGVYHECKNCTEGNNIEKPYLKEGKPDGAKLCATCSGLQRDNKCTWGTPTPAK